MPVLAIVAIAALVVSFVIMSLIAKRPKIRPTAVDDFQFPTADEGTPQAVLFGDAWQKGPNVMWYGNYRTKKIEKSAK